MKLTNSLEQYVATHPKSQPMYEKALSLIARGVTHDLRYLQPFPIYVTHAKGAYKWDVDGNRYVDYLMGHGALLLGHAHPSLVAAVSEQIAKGTHYGSSHELELEWAGLIGRLIPSAERVEFTNSGTEANMMAVRLARSYTGKKKIVRFQGHFHGWYDQMMIGGDPPYDVPDTTGLLPAALESVVVIPCNDETALERALEAGDVAALIVEPAGVHTGVTGIAPAFYPAMRRLTQRYGALLIFDEVVTGFRFSPGGVQTLRRISPDLTSLGKIVAGGIPGAGAVVGRADIMELLQFKDPEWNRYHRVTHPGTFNANPLCAAAGVATLRIVATGEPQTRADELTRRLCHGFEDTIREHGIQGCSYAESSVPHLFFGRCQMRRQCDRIICLNGTKSMPASLISALERSLLSNGVHMARGTMGWVSSVHTEEDIDFSIKALDASLRSLVAEEAFVRGEWDG